MKNNVIEMLDRIASNLQSKGLLEEATQIDVVSNTLEKSNFNALLQSPIAKELNITIRDIPKTPQEIFRIMKDVEKPESGKLAADKSSIARKILLVLLGISGIYGLSGLSATIAILGYDVAYDITHKSPNAALADLELLRKYFPKIRETVFNREPENR